MTGEQKKQKLINVIDGVMTALKLAPPIKLMAANFVARSIDVLNIDRQLFDLENFFIWAANECSKIRLEKDKGMFEGFLKKSADVTVEAEKV